MNQEGIDQLSKRYKTLRLIYFPHWKVSPWERREKEETIGTFLNDLEAYLLTNHWSVETRSMDARVYRYDKRPEVSLRVKNHIDYFGVHTVYLVEMELVRERPMLWPKVLAEGEVVFDHLGQMT